MAFSSSYQTRLLGKGVNINTPEQRTLFSLLDLIDTIPTLPSKILELGVFNGNQTQSTTKVKGVDWTVSGAVTSADFRDDRGFTNFTTGALLKNLSSSFASFGVNPGNVYLGVWTNESSNNGGNCLILHGSTLPIGRLRFHERDRAGWVSPTNPGVTLTEDASGLALAGVQAVQTGLFGYRSLHPTFPNDKGIVVKSIECSLHGMVSTGPIETSTSATGSLDGTLYLGSHPAASGINRYALRFYVAGKNLTPAEDALLAMIASQIERIYNTQPDKEILFIGDSLTNGTGATTPQQGWATLYALQQNALAINCGIGGASLSKKDLTGALGSVFSRDSIHLFREGIKVKAPGREKRFARILITLGFNDRDNTSTGSDTSPERQIEAASTLNEILAAIFRAGYVAQDLILLGVSYNVASTEKNRYGNELMNKSIIALAASYGIPFVEQWAWTRDNVPNDGTNFIGGADGIHWPTSGHAAVAQNVLTNARIPSPSSADSYRSVL